MAILQGRNNSSLSCLRLLVRQQQRKCHAFAEESQGSAKTHSQVIADVAEAKPGVARVDMKKWKKLDSRTLGIDCRAIPSGQWTVMRILRHKGFDSYLVGGCVRDLLLKKTPKDFDVITEATLSQIKKTFHRAEVVGQRFPICLVHINGSTTEVSSFETVAKHSGEKKPLSFSQAPHGCAIKDFTRWRDSMRRDFTVNSLFLDPFSNKVYDYSGGMSDLKSLKLRTIIPAKDSFEEDCARILRGLRIAARLGLSFSKDTEAALLQLSPSITRLGKGRLFMELNYMLSYGAAAASLSLLQRFNLLEHLLPLQAVYLEQPLGIKSGQNSMMLTKLLSNMDKVVNCDHPSDCRLWVGLLAFHLTLVNNPQEAFVVLSLASILYHGEWKEGIRYARENSEVQVHFTPEVLGSSASKSDEELADEVSQLAAFIQDSINIFTESEMLLASMSRYPTLSCSGLVYIPSRVGQDVAELFQMLVKQNPSHEKKREDFGIDYNLLGKGFMWETRFVLGKIILESMGCKTFQNEENAEENDTVPEEVSEGTLSRLLRKHVLIKKKPGESRFLEETTKEKQNYMTPKKKLACEDSIKKKRQKVYDLMDESSRKLVISMVKDVLEKRYESRDEAVTEKKDVDEKTCQSSNEKLFLEKKFEVIIEEKREDAKEHTKMSKSKDKTPHTDERCESADSEVMTNEEKINGVKKINKKRKSSELLDEKEEDVKKAKRKSKVVKEEEKHDGVKTKKKKNSKSSELLDEKEEDVKKAKRKSKVVKEEEKRDGVKTNKKNSKASELLVERKNGGVKKTKRKSNSEKEVKDCRKEELEEKVSKKKKGSKKEEVESKKASVVVVEKVIDLLQEGNKEMVVRRRDENERKQVVENQNKTRTLLSSLFR